MKKILLATLLIIATPVFASNLYIQQYGQSNILEASDVYPDFTQAERLESPEYPSKITIVVASTSKLKMQAVEKFFRSNPAFAEHHLNFVEIKAASKIAEQPVSLDNAILGAKNRIKNAKSKFYKQKLAKNMMVYYVAIENFFTELNPALKPTDHALVIIDTPMGDQNIYLSKGVEISPEIYKQVINPHNMQADHTGSKTTIGAHLGNKYGANAADWFGLVTNHKLTREEQLASAFNLAGGTTGLGAP